MNPFFPFQCVDLTHALSSETPSWDGACGFSLKTTLDYDDCATIPPFRVQEMHLQCGIGTHMDMPAHCIPQGSTVESLSPETLISPCVVIDVSAKA